MAFGKILKFAKLNPAEEKDFKLLFIQSLLSGFGGSFFFVVVNTFFIRKTSVPGMPSTLPTSLPPAYIMSGIFGFVLIAFYKRWQRKYGVIKSYTIGFIIYSFSALLLFSGRTILGDNSHIAVYLAYIGFIVVLPYGSMQALGFSTICLRVFNISQSKRLLALIGTGEVLASIIAYLLIPFLKEKFGEAPLLLFSGIANFLAIIPLLRTYKNNKEKLDSIRFSSVQKKMDLAFFRKDKFYALLAIVTVFSVMAVYLADYTYLLSVRLIANKISDPSLGPAELTKITGNLIAKVFCVIKTGELLISFLSGTIIRSNGMKISLLMLPVLLVFASLTGFSVGINPFFLWFFLLLIKWAERVIRKGVTIPSMKVVYQATNPEERAQLQTSIDGTISQYATIGAGVLLCALSYSFFHNQFFLLIVAFVYFVVFAGWSWFTLLLYNSYKIKIKEYLHAFSGLKKQAAVTGEENGAVELEKESGAQHSLVKYAFETPTDFNQETLMRNISFYNPDLKNALEESSILKKIKIAYYKNENFFSRLLIIKYIEYQGEDARYVPSSWRIRFVKEYYGISELQLKSKMISMLDKTDYKLKQEDTFYLSGLCKDVVSEIMWAEACINDIEGQVEPLLVTALRLHIQTLKILIFELLKVLYDKESIQVVYEIINSKDQSLENQLFAIELLDNVLDPEMKKLVLPVMEDISFNTKKERLQKTIHIYHLSCADRLKEILMANFMIVGPHIKQLALQEYYKITNDKTILNAFAASYLENLNATASHLLNTDNENNYIAKTKAIESMNLDAELNADMLSHFTKWGLFYKNKRKNNSGASEYLNKQIYQLNPDFLTSIKYDQTEISIDLLGLSLILKMNEN